jgi:hypothetical protein
MAGGGLGMEHVFWGQLRITNEEGKAEMAPDGTDKFVCCCETRVIGLTKLTIWLIKMLLI